MTRVDHRPLAPSPRDIVFGVLKLPRMRALNRGLFGLRMTDHSNGFADRRWRQSGQDLFDNRVVHQPGADRGTVLCLAPAIQRSAYV